jgi:FkbM family methyltransferase
MVFVSYAPNFEDVLLHRVFGGQETGFYVDIGAYHPVIGSVTKAFYDRGWCGINIEPGSVFAELAGARPRDVNLQIAVGDRAGEIAFIENEANRGTSHVAKDETEIGARRTVPCDTLEAIVQAYSGNRPLDFVKIYVEGAEAAIVRSTNWRRLRPRVLLLEATLPWSNTLCNQEWEPVLLEQGYVRAYFDGINCFYIPEEEVAVLLRHFQVPVNMLDRAIRHDDGAARTAFNDQQQEIARLVGELAVARTALANQHKEMVPLFKKLDATRATSSDQRKEMARPVTEVDVPVLPPRSIGRLGIRGVARLIRPVARRLAWRLRGFLIGGLSEQIQHPTLAEMRRLALEMERALLTLTMERAPHSLPDIGLVHPEYVPTFQRVALRLPHDRTTEVECAPGDLSISGQLRASDGDWEPHVRRYLESVVRPDWVCLDIGANLGAHTLSLAVLAHEGQVVAFEADSANFELLTGNAAALPAPRAAIKAEHVALWDSQGTLVSGGADELAGCSFVAEEGTVATLVERRLRAVVDAEAIKDTELHVRLTKVRALPVDTWVDDNPLPRLDLIKLDVEGAEARVIRGADAVLRKYRPILIVGYNPACAEAYFGQPPEVLFHELEARFAGINALEPDGTLTPLADWTALQARLTAGKGWEDLVCLPETLM